MTTGHVFIAASLDGFIARPDHGLDWLMKQPTSGEDHGYDAFIKRMDGLIMGASTFRSVLGFDQWPYAKPVLVMSSTLTDAAIPDRLRDKVAIRRGAPAEVMEEARASGWSRAYVDGGQLIGSFLRAGLIEDMVVTLVPILIGEGRRLFDATGPDIDLDLLEARPFPSGLLRMHYRVRPRQ